MPYQESMKKILIYSDSGADTFSVNSLHLALRLEGVDQKYEITSADRHLLQTSCWQKDAFLLIFPGGRDIPYHQALQGAPNAHIRDFVNGGGRYFGICAGSYYGCGSIEFEKGCPLEVLAERELKFFPGIASGPAYGKGTFCYQSQRGAKIATLNLCPSTFSVASSMAYYNGGCTFLNSELHPHVKILARYNDINEFPSAIISCQVGEGRALLSGVHPEYSYLYEPTRKFLTEKQFTDLQEIELPRRQLFTDLLNILELQI